MQEKIWQELDKQLPELLQKLKNNARKLNAPLYLVGGALRDFRLKKTVKDWDLAGDAKLLPYLKKAAKTQKLPFFCLNQEWGQFRFILSQEELIDYLPLPPQGIIADLKRRDFTINAMALDLPATELIDPFKGEKALKQKLLKTTSPRALKADPLRLLRAVRFVCQLKFKLETETKKQIRRNAHLLSLIPGERVRDELFRLLELPNAYSAFKKLEELSLFLVLFPEFKKTKGVGQNQAHQYDVYRHSLKSLKEAELLVEKELSLFFPWEEKLKAHFNRELTAGRKRKALFKLAALWHDLGKPESFKLLAEAKITFYGHPDRGSEKAENIARRLMLSGEESEYLKNLVLNHMRPLLLERIKVLSTRAKFRLFRDLGDNLPDLLLLAFSDLRAGKGKKVTSPDWEKYFTLLQELLKDYYTPSPLSVPVRYLNGNQVMELLGIPPSPRVGEILKALEEAAALEIIKSPKDAKEYLVKHFFKL